MTVLVTIKAATKPLVTNMQTQAQVDAVVDPSNPPKLEHKKFKINDLVNMPNVAVHLNKNDRNAIGTWVVNGYNKDKQSRVDWEQKMEQAMKLALQVKEVKSFPWTNCSNIKFPLLTIAALQFLARVSILTSNRNLVKMEVVGGDEDGRKSQQAKRISQHMSYQMCDEDISFYDEDEKAKFAASIVGHAIKKRHWDSIRGTQCSKFIPSQNFVTDYYTTHLEGANRMTEVLSLSKNKIQTRVRQGLFLEMEEPDMKPGSVPADSNLLKKAADEQQGVHPLIEGEEFPILEQHNWFDLDGDGYAEPYIMFVRQDTGQLLRIVARFYNVDDVHRVNDSEVRKMDSMAKAADDAKIRSEYERKAKELEEASDNHILCIDAAEYYNKTIFIPSPDGGGLGLGFGSLLGPMNESVDSLVNQLVDAGTMSNTAGGFLGRGVKLKGGKTSFDPFEWKPADSTGDDLRKNIFPLPVREPSAVLFNLLGMLVQYSEKISGATDIMTGVSPGQNTPAETSRNTVEQGMMLFSGIYKRMYRAFRQEICLAYKLNSIFLETSPEWEELTNGSNAMLLADDYKTNKFRIFPAASPEAISKTQIRERATMVMQWAMQTPGTDKYEANRRWLEAYDIDDIDTLYPNPKSQRAIPTPPNPELELQKQELAFKQQEHSDTMQLEIAKLQSQHAVNQSKIIELQAKAAKEAAEAQGVDRGHAIAEAEMQIAALKLQNEKVNTAVNALNALRNSTMQHVQHLDKMSIEHKKLNQPKEPTGGNQTSGTN